jgi:hypothetical protein
MVSDPAEQDLLLRAYRLSLIHGSARSWACSAPPSCLRRTSLFPCSCRWDATVFAC